MLFRLSSLPRRLARLAGDDGQALVLVVFLVAFLALLAPLLISAVQTGSSQAADAVVRTRARAAADAGVNAYIAKLLLDNQYYLQYLAPGEATRHPSSGSDVSSVLPPASPTVWPNANGTSWTYPSKDAWVDLGNGYSYDLEVTAPNTGSNTSNAIEIVATGKQTSATSSANDQVVQVLVRPASVADFQMLSNSTVSYGSAAVTWGKIYSAQNLQYAGTAHADLYAEGTISMTGTLVSPAKSYDKSTIRTVIKSPINFADFQVSLTDIKRAAIYANGVYLNNPKASAWQLTFTPDGNVTFASCTSKGGTSVQTKQPTCNGSLSNSNTSLLSGAGSGTVAIPANGAIYSDQDILIGPGSSTCGSPQITSSNCIEGRVTVASGQDVVVGGNIEYVDPTTDVFGIIGQNNVWVASWANAGGDLTWRAATLAENGVWSQPTGVYANSHGGTMTFYGSSATNKGGAMDMFPSRSYNYDTNLEYLQPPWFPTLQQAYTVLLYRNLPNGS